MEQSVVIQKLTDSFRDIFAFSASRLYDKQDAEDLTNDIIVEVLASAERLKKDDAFYGFMWSIAENTLKRYIRKQKIGETEYQGDFYGVYWDTPEEKLLESEELAILRRELSLLSKQYRDVTVRYYIENKSCTAIANELDISEEMVKYYLFKTRKILKEGVTMERKYGEKSYNPGKFRIDFWGGGNNGYVWNTFERRLPGNIVLAAYEKPLGIEELSLELGVSAPYLEDELAILLKYDFVRMIGNKYQTNFLIFKTPYEEEIRRTLPYMDYCSDATACIMKMTEKVLSQFRKKNFGISLDENRLKWFIVNFALLNALGDFEERTQEKYGDYPKLFCNCYGYVFGHDNDYNYDYFAGIYGGVVNKANTARYAAVNYNVIRPCQHWQGCSVERAEALCDGILGNPVTKENEETVAQLVREGMLFVADGRIKANFPTFTSKADYLMRKELKEGIDAGAECMEMLCTAAAEIFKKYAPKNLQDRCERLCYVRHQVDPMAIIVEKLVADGFLVVPKEPTNLCIFGIKKQSVNTD